MIPQINQTQGEELVNMMGQNPDMDMDLLTDEELTAYQGETGFGQELIPKEDPSVNHYKNLVSTINSSDLSFMAQELIQKVEEDELTRKDWEERVEKVFACNVR